jgi:hypothetical protein
VPQKLAVIGVDRSNREAKQKDFCETTDSRLDAGVPYRSIEHVHVRLHNADFDGAAYSALSALGRSWDVVHQSIKRVLHYVRRATGARGADRYG